MVDTFSSKMTEFPDPASAAIRRYFVEGNGSILGGGVTKYINILKLPLVSDRSYWASGWVFGRIANADQGSIAHREISTAGAWDGSAWESVHSGMDGPASSQNAAQMDAAFAVAAVAANGFALALVPDKTDNTYFWWRFQVIEIDSTFPALP